MNRTIEEIFSDYYVPVSFLRYDGNETTYITYMETEKDGVLAGDNEIIGYIDYYDFDIYSKGNYLSIVEDVKSRLKANGFTLWLLKYSANSSMVCFSKYCTMPSMVRGSI